MAEGSVTDPIAIKPGDERSHSHHRRRRSRGTRESQRSGGQSILSRLGRKLNRRGKVVVCLWILIVSVGLSAIMRWIETPDASTNQSVVSAVGFWPAVFVIASGVGALGLAEAIGYKRKRLWLTSLVLMIYLLLHAVTWHRAYSIAHDTLEPQIMSFDNPVPLPPPTPAAIDVYILGLYTIGTLSVISTLMLMRKLVRWGTPSAGSLHRRERSERGEADGEGTAVAHENDDPTMRPHGLPEVKEVELSALDHVRPVAEPPASAPLPPLNEDQRGEPTENQRDVPRRRKPMFE
jgi:hypothetical protein